MLQDAGPSARLLVRHPRFGGEIADIGGYVGGLGLRPGRVLGAEPHGVWGVPEAESFVFPGRYCRNTAFRCYVHRYS